MGNNSEKERLNSRILEIISDCKSAEGIKVLNSIYETLNSQNSLQTVGLGSRIKHFFRSFNPRYKEVVERRKIEVAQEETLQAISKYIISGENIFQHNVIKDMPSELGRSIIDFLDLSLGLEFTQDKVKRYPLEITEEIKMHEYRTVLNQMAQEYFEQRIPLHELVKKYRDNYNEKTEEIKEKSRHCEIEPYYSSKEFMEYRIGYIKECMEKLLESSRFNGREDIQNDIVRIGEILQTYRSTSLNINSIEQQKTNYRVLEELYKEVLQMEEILSKDVEKVWKEKLSSPEAYSKDGQFAFLAHVITEGEFEPEHMHKLCMTYITEKTLTLPYGDYGLIYPMDMDNVSAMSPGDAGSWKFDKEEFINRRISKKLAV